jgi:hypothetical protein
LYPYNWDQTGTVWFNFRADFSTAAQICQEIFEICPPICDKPKKFPKLLKSGSFWKKFSANLVIHHRPIAAQNFGATEANGQFRPNWRNLLKISDKSMKFWTIAANSS